MGRTVPTFRQLIEQELQRWRSGFGRALRQEERRFLELLFNRVRRYLQACTHESPVHAMDAIHVAVGLDHEIRLRRLEARLGLTPDAPGMDSRPLPEPAGDDAVADGAEPEAPSAD
jgi:hypothetical protein